MSEVLKPQNTEAAAIQSSASSPAAEFPSEPFSCPACGQMLAPSCRVCVACKQTINPAEIKMPDTPVPRVEPGRPVVRTSPVRFSWPIFFYVLLSWFLLAGLADRFLGPVRGQLLLGGVVILSSAWVYYDAHNRLVPKPLRWGLGSLLLWVVVFPWYLARRRDPIEPCRFVEAEVSPLVRLLLAILVFLVLLGIVIMVLKQVGLATNASGTLGIWFGL